jgi:uncharacterized membrane protein YhaH (DUF805 family)
VRGNVIGFDPDTNTGAISGHDGNRYDFVTQEWRARRMPRRGDIVDFQAIDLRATEIYLIEPVYVAPGLGAFYFSPSGRISRSQYWLKYVLPYAVIVLILEILAAATAADSAANAGASMLLAIFSLVTVWPSIAVLVKRIHDRNKSGWFILFLFVPAALLTALLFAWFGAALLAIAAGQAATAIAPLGVLGMCVIILGLAVLGIEIWFFVEFGCLRGTIGANRFGPDPVRR